MKTALGSASASPVADRFRRDKTCRRADPDLRCYAVAVTQRHAVVDAGMATAMANHDRMIRHQSINIITIQGVPPTIWCRRI